MIGPSGVILLGIIIAALGAFWASRQQSVQQLRFETELRQRNDKIDELNERIVKDITGGDSFPRIMLMGQSDRILVHNAGKHPLYGVQSRFHVLDPQGRLRPGQRDGKTIQVGDVGSGQGVEMQRPWSVPEGATKYGVNVFSIARNGTTMQELRMVRVNGKWTSATRVFRGMGTDKPIFQQVDGIFPKAEIDWGESKPP